MAKLELKNGKLYFNDIEVKELTLDSGIKIQFPIEDITKIVITQATTIYNNAVINNATFT